MKPYDLHGAASGRRLRRVVGVLLFFFAASLGQK